MIQTLPAGASIAPTGRRIADGVLVPTLGHWRRWRRGSQYWLATEAGLPLARIKALECAGSGASQEELAALARALRVTAYELVHGKY